MTDAEADTEAVRAAAWEVLRLDHDGHTHEALTRARDLMLAHQDMAITHRLLGDLSYGAAARACLEEGTRKAGLAAAAPHLHVAREAFAAARRLAPDCIDIADALGDAFAASWMFREAECEYKRAQHTPQPTDPALHNAAYGMCMSGGHEHDRDPDFMSVRVEEVRARARASYSRMKTEQLLPIAIHRVLEAGMQLGAAEGRKQAKGIAEVFPDLGRAQYLAAYMDLEFVRSLDAAIDKRLFLRRTLVITERVARDYPKSPVFASFHAKLLFVLGEYDAAETECRRALEMVEPNDPQDDCIPVGSISGENRGVRLVSVACEFHELINKIVMLASDYWDSMSSERQRHSFLQVRLDVLQHEYNKVDPSHAFAMSDVRSFVKEHESWRFWICPLCHCKKFMYTGLLLSHMCTRHPRAVLPRLQSVLDQKLSDEALESDDSLHAVTFCEDSEQQDVTICFNKSSEVFKWLFYAPSSGVRPKPFLEIRQMKCDKGRMLLESIKDKMKTLPADRSSTEFAKAIPEIEEQWQNFLKCSVLDYREVILQLARSFLWRDLKKCMTEDPELAAKPISAADIDAIFTKEVVNPASNAVESSQTVGAQMVSGNCQESVHDEGDSSDNHGKNTESSDQTTDMVERETGLAAKLDKLENGPKISESNPEGNVHDEEESCDNQGKNTESSDQAICMVESETDLATKLNKLEIDPKISESNQESNVHDNGESSGNQGKNTKSLDQAIGMAESETDLAGKLDKLGTDPKISESNQESELHAEHESSDSPVSRSDVALSSKGTSEATVTDTKLPRLPTNTMEGKKQKQYTVVANKKSKTVEKQCRRRSQIQTPNLHISNGGTRKM
uniref:DUF629 domain-containing protein n=1 Tax=Zea mays TaxID=4577 RepID=A0A804NKK7_MAIZE